MKKYFVYCDMCENEVNYHLLPRYYVDETLKEIVRRRAIEVNHLCELCMNGLNSAITEAVDTWKIAYGK